MRLRNKLAALGTCLIILLLTFFGNSGFAQLTLGTSPYIQDFDGLPTMPLGWTVRTSATNASLGTINAVGINTWASSTGEFRTVAAAEAPFTAGSSNAAQAAATDRALAVRPTGTFADPGAAFTLEIDNTIGKAGFSLAFKHMTFDDNASRSAVYAVQYTTVAAGTSGWTTLGTYTTLTWGATIANYSFGTALDNISNTVWIRVVSLVASTGSGGRDTYGIDDVKIAWATNATPDVNITSPNPAAASGSIPQGSLNNVLYRADLSISSCSAVMTAASFTTSAGYVSTDIADFKLWYQPTSTFTGTGTLVGTQLSSLGPGAHNFNSLNHILPIGTGYLFLTADIACAASAANNFSVNAVGTANFTFTAANKTATPAPVASGLQTISAGGTPVNVSSVTVTPASGQLTIAWANPLCYDEIMILATDNAGTITTVPTGDGTLYTSSVSYNDGTNFPNLNANEFCIYRGGTSPVIMDNVVNGTAYNLTIFTRIGTNWSSGVNVSGIPATSVSVPFRSINSGSWNDYTIWQKNTGSWVAAAAGEFPNSTISDVQIQPGHVVVLNARGYAVHNLQVDATAKLYCNTNTQNKFLNIYGDVLCNGTIGNGATADDICFNFNAAVSQLYGTGTFSCGRIRKNTGASATTALTINMNVNTYWAGTQLYNNYTGSATAFNVTINNNFTCNNGGSIAVDGLTGSAFGNSYGTFTVNGTLAVPGILYLTTNNSSPYNCGVSIGATGVINAATVSMAASTGTATHNLSIANGGKLNITGTSGITPFSATGNTYTLNAGSTVEYSAAGAEPVQSGLSYSNLTISGSGAKTATGNVAVGNIFTLVGGTYSMSGLQVNMAANGTITGNGGNFANGASGGTVSFAGNGTINGTTPLTFRNLNINAGTVITSLNNCSTLNLNLVGGIFSIGSANQFNILTGGSVAATAGDFPAGVNGGILNFPGTGTFSGTCNPYNVYVSGAVNFGAGTVTIQNGGSFRINTGGSANTNGPFYATNSSLVYNTGAAFTAATEWYAAVSSGRGVPYHVTILASGTALAFGASASSRTMSGDLTISAGAGFALGTVSGGDLFIAGNWTRAATGTFTSNARKVTFNGTVSNQTVTVTGSGNEKFGYIAINKSTGLKVIQAATPNATMITLSGNPASAAPSNSLTMINGDLDLNQQTFNFSSWNGNQNNIQIDGTAGNLTRNILSSGGTGTFAVLNSTASTRTLTISRASANASLLVFGTGLTLTNSGATSGSGIDFGNGITTVNGTLELNIYGFVTGNPPTYGINSFLIYNTGGSFDRNVEWGALSGPGYPFHVTVQNNTSLQLNFPAINGNADRAIAGNLSIAAGSSVLLSTTAPNKLTVGGNLGLDGTLTLPTVSGGDIYIGGNWNRSATGIFTANDRAVFFNGAAASTITANGGQLFPYLYLVKNALANTLTLLDDISISKEFGITTGSFDLAAKNATLKSDATGTADFGMVGAAADVTYSGAGRFIIERYIPTGTAGGQHIKSWQYLAVPANGGQTINAGWQEGNVLPTVGTGGLGIIITNNTAGAGFDIIGGSGPSMKSFVPATNLWTGVPNTLATTLFNPKGYMVLVRGDRTVSAYNTAATPTTLRTRGKLFVPGSNPPVSTTIGAGSFESIGNPYASAIDFLNITRPAAPAIDSVFYVWDPLLSGTNGLGGFQTISSVTGYKPTPGGTANYSSATAYTKIQSGQAFMMHATGAGGTVSFTENAKLSGSNMVYRITPSQANGRQYLRAELLATNGILLDANVVAFDNGFDNNYESNDALKILKTAENFGILSNTKTLVIEARSPVTVLDTIQYLLTNTTQSSYRFKFIPENMNAGEISAWLFDKVLHTKTSISMTDTTVFDFSPAVSSGEALNTNRFMLVFKKKTAAILANVPIRKKENHAGSTLSPKTEKTASRGICVYPNPVAGKEMHVGFNNMTEGNYSIQLTSSTGQAIYEGAVFVAGNYFKDVIRLNDAVPGCYQLVITAADGNKTIQSVIIK